MLIFVAEALAAAPVVVPVMAIPAIVVVVAMLIPEWSILIYLCRIDVQRKWMMVQSEVKGKPSL